MSVPAAQFLVFRCAGAQFALRVEEVERVVLMVELADSPDPRPDVLGLMNLHGEYVPVVDLALRLGRRSTVVDERTAIIVCARPRVGFVAEEVVGIEGSLYARGKPREATLIGDPLAIDRIEGAVFPLDPAAASVPAGERRAT